MNNHQEIWINAEDGSSMCALINGDVGWLMYLRHSGDTGFSSRNPNYTGDPSSEIDYILSNGQQDWYPAAWALPVEKVREALEYFRAKNKAPPFIHWHDDSNQG